MTDKHFSEQEIKYYRSMVAMIIDNDAGRKKSLDAHARMQVAAVKRSLPDSDPGVLVTFMVSIAFIMAKLLSTPLQGVTPDMEGVFNNNIVGAATIMGAYDPDSTDIPHWEPPADGGRPSRVPPDDMDAAAAAEMDKIINRQYL